MNKYLDSLCMFQKCRTEEALFEIAVHIQLCLKGACFMQDDSRRVIGIRGRLRLRFAAVFWHLKFESQRSMSTNEKMKKAGWGFPALE